MEQRGFGFSLSGALAWELEDLCESGMHWFSLSLSMARCALLRTSVPELPSIESWHSNKLGSKYRTVQIALDSRSAVSATGANNGFSKIVLLSIESDRNPSKCLGCHPKLHHPSDENRLSGPCAHGYTCSVPGAAIIREGQSNGFSSPIHHRHYRECGGCTSLPSNPWLPRLAGMPVLYIPDRHRGSESLLQT